MLQWKNKNKNKRKHISPHHHDGWEYSPRRLEIGPCCHAKIGDVARGKIFFFCQNSMDFFPPGCYQCHLSNSSNLDSTQMAAISIKFYKLASCRLAAVPEFLNMKQFGEGLVYMVAVLSFLMWICLSSLYCGVYKKQIIKISSSKKFFFKKK